MPLTSLDLRGVPAAGVAARLPRPPERDALPTDAVRAILDEVRAGGDAAVRALTNRFDGVDVPAARVPYDDIAAAPDRIADDLRAALELAYRRIVAYHRVLPPEPAAFALDGIEVEHLVRPVDRVGIYAPGGRALYPSTVLMCAAPARVAGVGELVLVAPPDAAGGVAPETLAAARIAGIDEVYRIGGAQAVAALAFGTESIRPVDVLVGPGNRYVAEAKRQVSGVVGVPAGFAGPSEVVVVADGTSPAELAAIDLVVQAEHGPDGLAWLVTWSKRFADRVATAVDRLVAASPRRADLESTLAGGGYAVVVDGPSEAMAVANAVAPEHLELQVEAPRLLLPMLRHAAAVFLGPNAPASIGDYLAGPNHVLPTARTARFSSALRVDDFRTHIHAVTVHDEALRWATPPVVVLAEAEGLPAHAESVRARLARLDAAEPGR